MIKNDLNIVCIIPARGESKDIPKKNIINVAGKPLIAWSIEQASKSKYIKNNVYVSSDCDEILTISKSFGAKGLKRPKAISSDESSSESALSHAISIIEENNKPIDIVVFLQATSPLRSDDDIDNAIDEFINKKYDSLFSACNLKDLLVWTHDINKKLKSINYNYLKRERRQDITPQYGENGSIYIFKPQVLLQNNNRLGGKIGMFLMDVWKLYEIDITSDIEICEFYLKEKIIKEDTNKSL